MIRIYLDRWFTLSLASKTPRPLARTAEAFEMHFGKYLHDLKWINRGWTSHHTTDYDINYFKPSPIFKKSMIWKFIQSQVKRLVTTHSLAAEPEIAENEQQIAILDVSATCHMPDVLEMPYRPEVRGAAEVG